MSMSIVKEVVTQLETLPDDLQQQVLDFVKNLKGRQGTPGKKLIQFAGAIPPDQLQQMSQAIQEGCEQVETFG